MLSLVCFKTLIALLAAIIDGIHGMTSKLNKTYKALLVSIVVFSHLVHPNIIGGTQIEAITIAPLKPIQIHIKASISQIQAGINGIAIITSATNQYIEMYLIIFALFISFLILV